VTLPRASRVSDHARKNADLCSALTSLPAYLRLADSSRSICLEFTNYHFAVTLPQAVLERA
jgi:hypothetical protein